MMAAMRRWFVVMRIFAVLMMMVMLHVMEDAGNAKTKTDREKASDAGIFDAVRDEMQQRQTRNGNEHKCIKKRQQ